MNKEYIKNLVESYIGDEAFSVKENSTLTKSVSAMNSHIFSDIISNYWLDEIYTSEIAEAHRNRTIHLKELEQYRKLVEANPELEKDYNRLVEIIDKEDN